ncbi:hypothetical protein [Mycobacteroides abscessus]|uniref:hypothetical protein n=1 Tax=Mycobacteroides abscessus TaxID=36809 RepID=UPI000929CFEC|nr:hypothetical protein [Mycobacteroides abscessus]SIN44850.1 Uncharacterised protein [Mycobacteroides abscessus subsp. abscessus]
MTVTSGPFFNVVDEDSRHRRELRERALYSATLLHCETGDTMAILDRETAVKDALATAQQFYDWIAQEAR